MRKDHWPRLKSGPGRGNTATTARGSWSRLTPPHVNSWTNDHTQMTKWLTNFMTILRKDWYDHPKNTMKSLKSIFRKNLGNLWHYTPIVLGILGWISPSKGWGSFVNWLTSRAALNQVFIKLGSINYMCWLCQPSTVCNAKRVGSTCSSWASRSENTLTMGNKYHRP